MGLKLRPFKIPAHRGIGHEAADLAGHPDHSLGKAIGISAAASTLSGVGAYQINTHIAKKTHAPEPSLSLTTGAMPNATANTVNQVGMNAHKNISNKRRKTNANPSGY